MANTTGNKYGGRTKGTPNKITADVEDKLQLVMDDVVPSFNISTLTTDQKIKMLQIGLQYLIPRLKHTSGDRDNKDYPLFITDGEPIAINTHKRNEETGKFEIWSRTLGK
tara:strand:+ start:173 stop:502 length:330 start_codon:yes stop_codon:yes gene_type:complete